MGLKICKFHVKILKSLADKKCFDFHKKHVLDTKNVSKNNFWRREYFQWGPFEIQSCEAILPSFLKQKERTKNPLATSFMMQKINFVESNTYLREQRANNFEKNYQGSIDL